MSPIIPNSECNSNSADVNRFLIPAVVSKIERALAQVGDFGEVRLVVVKGQLKFIQVTQSQSLNEPPR